MQGVIKFFDKKQKYGFIISQGHDQDIYFRLEDMACAKQLTPESTVSFQLESLDCGKIKATDITVLTQEKEEPLTSAKGIMYLLKAKQRKFSLFSIGIFALGTVFGYALQQYGPLLQVSMT